jgi:uncharacterized membrane protein
MAPQAKGPDRPQILHVEWEDIRAALASGWRDIRAAPQFGLFFASVYVAGGWLLLWAFTAQGQAGWLLPASVGFPILGPFIACGLYEVSRRRAAGEGLDWGGILASIFRQKDRQIPAIAAVIVVFFLFWNFLSHMLFALFLGNAVMTNISTSLAVFATPAGLGMLVLGTVVGAALTALLFAMTVVALPMLMAREVDFVTAMLTSIALVRESPVVMLGWGALIGAMMLLGIAAGFLGLFIVLPWLGHATWHLYTRAIEWG